MAGTYRIDSEEFPAPLSRWEENPIVDGLNILPVLSSYRRHIWNWAGMRGCDFERLITLFDEQQDDNAQLSELETDPFDVSLSDSRYGTTTYTDFAITSLSPRIRGLPHYDDVTITFEVYIA